MCRNAEDCGDTTVYVCDPTSLTCVPGECNGNNLACAADQVCVGQVASPVIGACYEGCTLFATGMGCAGADICLPIEFGGTVGGCFLTGPGPLNGTCTEDDVSSGCVAGAVCIDDGGANPQCRDLCNFFGSPAGCGTGLLCGVNNVCTGIAPDPAPINTGHCAADATAGDGCGANANAVRGVCIDAGDPTLSCLKWCRLTGNDCTGGRTCIDVLMDGSPVGVCD